MDERVARAPYFLWGSSLFLLKYLGEALLYYSARGIWLAPLNFFSPLLDSRYPGWKAMPDWFGPSIALWSLPFIWIGVSMTVRRAADAGHSPWLGVLFFIPLLNYLLMLVLSLLPTTNKDTWSVRRQVISDSRILEPLTATLVFAIAGTGLAWFFTNGLMLYSTTLFAGGPLLLGLAQGYYLNRKGPLPFGRTVGYVALSVAMINLLLLLFALEGLICLFMALPITVALAIFGALIGSAIARYAQPNRATPAMLVMMLPILPWMETRMPQTHSDVVISSIEVDRPPEKVWPNVVKFSDLPPTDDLLFRLGVAYPMRARIAGEGVGAIRRCEFSTGAFVEPITVWNEPSHLAFDVRFQPPAMHELSFYDTVHAPHLNGYFRSVKGEFNLRPLPGGRTLLEGRTWYEVDMQPGWYWQLYGRWFIHKIHLRVLNHIKGLAEV